MTPKAQRYFRDLFDAGRFDQIKANGVAVFEISDEERRYFPELDRIEAIEATILPVVGFVLNPIHKAEKAGLATGDLGKSEASTTIYASPAIVMQRRA